MTADPGSTPVLRGPGTSAARASTEDAFLDAAERLLVSIGHGGITTRVLAEEAGANHGLVHYYFGSMDNLFVRVLERFTARLIVRQRQMYGAAIPFLAKWRQAMRYLDIDREYQKVWLELQALSWSRPHLRDRVAAVNEAWRVVLTEALAAPRDELRIEMPLDALVSLVMTLNEGIMLERLSGVEAGQQDLLDWIDGWLGRRQAEAGGQARTP